MTIFRGLHFNNIRGDIYGGLTAAVVALPLALAMGVSSGAGPIAGIYGAVFVGIFAALFGGTPAQVSGPTGPMTVVMAAIFTHYTAMFPDDPAHGAALAFSVVLLGGLFQIVFSFLKLGKYINLMPHSVISGFMSGIGVIIILLQLGPLLGHASQPGPLASAMALPKNLAHPIMADVILAALALLIVYLLPQRVNRILPAPLIALIGGTIALVLWAGTQIVSSVEDGVTVFRLGGAAVLGEIPMGFPMPTLPTIELALLPDMIKSALMLAALGSIDSLLTSLVADNITRNYHDSDRELLGQGIGNFMAGLFGGLPGAGATMRTVVNVRAGGRTPLSGALHAVVLLTVVLGAGVVASYIPHAILAGILVKVGYDIIDWDYLKRIRHIPLSGVTVMLSVFLMTVFVDLITAVAVGMIMAAFIFMKSMVDLQLESIMAITDPGEESPLLAEEKAILKQAKGRILLFRVAGPMSFGAAKDMVRRLAAIDQFDVLVLDLSDVPQIDYTSVRAVDDMLNGARERGREAFLAGCKKKVCDMLMRQQVLEKINEERLKHTRLSALQDALQVVIARQAG
ncbi:MAG: SulP family inorganic anion transporter [Gammaproteobacteria bacterium]|nr:SulP family inorganic anion transporter [Gammaproteobacteria bacterium]